MINISNSDFFLFVGYYVLRTEENILGVCVWHSG